MLIDLQVHSTYSDGYMTPTEVAKYLANIGVKVAALTDHNTVGGIAEFRRAGEKLGMKIINGIELYVKFGSKNFNILWYNFDENDPDLHRMLRNSQTRRRMSVRRIMYRLASEGYVIDADKILDKYNHYVPINHVVDDIITNSTNKAKLKEKLGYDPREGDMIRELFYNKKATALRESYISFEIILKLRKKIGGQLILNHPGKYHFLHRDMIKSLKELGLDGLEILTPHHNIGGIMHAQFIAKEFDFIGSGSSDFHKLEGGNMPVQSSWDYYRISTHHLRKIEKIIGKIDNGDAKKLQKQ